MQSGLAAIVRPIIYKRKLLDRFAGRLVKTDLQ